jgi:hypothetical protein
MFNDEYDNIVKMINSGISTKDIQDYLMSKFNVNRSKTSNIIKKVRKDLGIYNKKI